MKHFTLGCFTGKHFLRNKNIFWCFFFLNFLRIFNSYKIFSKTKLILVLKYCCRIYFTVYISVKFFIFSKILSRYGFTKKKFTYLWSSLTSHPFFILMKTEKKITKGQTLKLALYTFLYNKRVWCLFKKKNLLKYCSFYIFLLYYT